MNAFNNVPRFGHKTLITDLYSDDGLDTELLRDYMLGSIFVGGFCIALLVIWLLTLIICKCLGRKRVGVLVGHPFEEDKFEEDNLMQKAPRKHTGFRVVLVMSALIIACSAVLFLVKGGKSIRNLFDDIRDGAEVRIMSSFQ